MDRVCDYKELQLNLASLADDEYREFSMKGIPSERPFIGVRVPLILRRFRRFVIRTE